ncbi:MAG: hypothetical protein PHD81_00340 [Candidatus Nanoarchaeia archaeon]|nr:hypothetical protein [Candidatus Nanoarchaeia archaeon]MDD5587540.1 hypothetical protein [Candidatus Nanoarchaeia archaeon]
MKNKNHFLPVLINILVLCIIIGAVSAYFVYNDRWIGLILIGLGILCLLSLKLFNVKIKNVWPDIVFGLIDNGILAIFALVGANIAGVVGAIIGGVVGNSITDGIAGIFEGFAAETLRKNKISEKRTILSSAIGKMAGCLIGAGIVLYLSYLIQLF